jgi:hypothetical protein
MRTWKLLFTVAASLLLQGTAWAGEVKLRVDDRAPSSDALAAHATARGADVVRALEAYFRGEPAPAGQQYGNLTAALETKAVTFQTRAERDAVDTAIARICGWAQVENVDTLERLVVSRESSSLREELELQHQRADLSPAARQRVRRMLRHLGR